MQIFFTEPSLVGFASKDQDLSSWPPSQITDSPVIWFQRRWGVRSYSEGCCGAKIFRIRWVEWSWPGRVPSGPSRTGPPSATLPPAHLALHTQQRRWLLRLQTGVRPCPRLDICKRPSLGRGRRVEGCQWWRLRGDKDHQLLTFACFKINIFFHVKENKPRKCWKSTFTALSFVLLLGSLQAGWSPGGSNVLTGGNFWSNIWERVTVSIQQLVCTWGKGEESETWFNYAMFCFPFQMDGFLWTEKGKHVSLC